MIAISPERPSGAIPAPEPTNPESGIRNPESPSALLRAEGLRKAFGGQIVLDGVDLELHQGEVVLLRGENGSGKTTLLNILTGNLEPDAGAIQYLADGSPRSYRFPRRWWQELNPFDHFTPEFVAREGMGRTWQDVRLFASQPLRDNIAVAETGHPGENPLLALLTPGRCARREIEINRDADAMLARFGLAGRESSSADKISLGQSKRVAIARAVAAGAQILFLDEPLAGLDGQGVRDVLALLESLVREDHVTLVIVEHVFNQPHLHGLVTTDWLLEKGKIQDSKFKTSRPNSPLHAPSWFPPFLTMKHMKKHEGSSDSPLHAPSCPSWLISPSETQARPSWFSLLAGDDAEILDEPLPRGALLTRIRRKGRMPKAEARSNPQSAIRNPQLDLPPKPVLEIKDLVVKRGRRTVIGLDDEGHETGSNLTLHEGEIAILQAPNGWGKSTLFEAICGSIPIAAGTLSLNGIPLQSRPSWQRIKAGLSAAPSAAPLFPSLRVHEAARLAHASGNPTEIPFAQRAISSLSGGEKQRTVLRLTLPDASTPNLALLDEPFAMLDDKATHLAVETFKHKDPRHAFLILLPATRSSNS